MLSGGFIEPVPIADVFCSGIAGVERVGQGCLRFSLFVWHSEPGGAGTQERMIVAKIVMSEVDHGAMRDQIAGMKTRVWTSERRLLTPCGRLS